MNPNLIISDRVMNPNKEALKTIINKYIEMKSDQKQGFLAENGK